MFTYRTVIGCSQLAEYPREQFTDAHRTYLKKRNERRVSVWNTVLNLIYVIDDEKERPWKSSFVEWLLDAMYNPYTNRYQRQLYDTRIPRCSSMQFYLAPPLFIYFLSYRCGNQRWLTIGRINGTLLIVVDLSTFCFFPFLGFHFDENYLELVNRRYDSMKLFDEMEQHFMPEEEIDVRWIKKEKNKRDFRMLLIQRSIRRVN